MEREEQGATPGAAPVAVYTIGHGVMAADDLVALLRAHGVAQVVDVRSIPYSQYTSQFNREALAPRLREQGIGYAFAGDYLGGRPKDPACYKDGRLPEGKANYLKLVDYPTVAQQPWYQRGIDRLLQLACERPTSLMCSEEDPTHCHRHHLITTTLLQRGVRVSHLRADGSVQDAAALPMPREEPPEQQLRLF